MRKTLFILIIALIVPWFSYAASEEKAKIIIKIATIAPNRTSIAEIMEDFRTEVKEKTNNEVDFKIYYGGVQGDESDVLRKIRVRQLHGGSFTGFGLGKIAPPVRVTEIPFVFWSSNEVSHVRAQLAETLSKHFEDNGFVVFGWHNIGFVYLFSKQPITSIEELRKQKCWVWGDDPMMGAAYRALGVTPVPLSVTDVLTSLTANLVDVATVTPLGAIVLRWYSRFKYVTDLPGGNGMGAVVVKKEIWDKISPESQKKIKEIGKFHFDRLTQSNIEADRKAIELLKQQGITIVHFEEPEEVLEEMGKMARESVVGKVYSRELLDKTLSILEEYRKNHPTKTFVRIK